MLSDTEQADGMKTKAHRQTGRRQRERMKVREGKRVDTVGVDKGMDG